MPTAAATAGPATAPVLVYVWHQVAPTGWPLTHGSNTITPAHFAQECAWIRRHHVRTLTAGEFLAFMHGRLAPKRPALYLTFDNGLEGVYRFAFPILRRYRLHATLFIIADRTRQSHADGRDLAYLTWPQIRTMLRSGLVDVQAEASGLHSTVRVGGRTRPLALQAPGESTPAYRRRLTLDFQAQRRLFLTHLHYGPRLLVWPFSTWTPTAEVVARRYGAEVFFTVGVGFATPGQPDAVPRNSATMEWENLGLSVVRMLQARRSGSFRATIHYLWGCSCGA